MLNKLSTRKDEDKERYILLFAVLSGIIVFFIGFFAMYIFWCYDIQNPKLPGLFDYKAATYGDGICLPVLTGAGVGYILLDIYYKSGKDRTPQIHKCSKICSCIALVVG